MNFVERFVIDEGHTAQKREHDYGYDLHLITYDAQGYVEPGSIYLQLKAAETLQDIGGLEVLKDWLLKRKDAFGQRAKDYGLPTPKGLLILGIPGTGKSLTELTVRRKLEAAEIPSESVTVKVIKVGP